MYSIFHIYVKKGRGKRRTSISIETILTDLFAIKLGYEPGSREAHSAIRLWLQEKQDEQNSNEPQSLIIKKELILEVAQKRIVDKYITK